MLLDPGTFVEGDNLDVLPTLEPVDLVYIDPPYNTGNEFAYRDDFRGHAAWVAMMRPRVSLTAPGGNGMKTRTGLLG